MDKKNVQNTWKALRSYQRGSQVIKVPKDYFFKWKYKMVHFSCAYF